MKRSILWSSLAGLLLGIAGCGSTTVTGPIDATKPAPIEPPAEGFVPPGEAK